MSEFGTTAGGHGVAAGCVGPVSVAGPGWAVSLGRFSSILLAQVEESLFSPRHLAWHGRTNTAMGAVGFLLN